MCEKEDIAHILSIILKAMVHHPEDIRVTMTQGITMTMVEIDANMDDYGLIIGKRGSMIGRIREIFNVIGQRRGEIYSIVTLDAKKRREKEA